MNNRLSITLAALGAAAFVALGTACADTTQPSAPSAKTETRSATAAFNPEDTINSVEKTLKPLMDAVAAEDIAYKNTRIFEVAAYGAVADGTTKNTQAIQKAIDACSAAGGGRVHFAKGDYLTGMIFLKAGAVLDLDAGARILGSTSLADYPSTPAQFNALYRNIFTQCLIYAEKADGVGIRGKGEIDMRGGDFHGPESNGALTGRPFMIRMTECNNVRIEGITLRRSASWMQHYLACDNLVIRNLKVQNFSNVNCDGADIDGCKNVWVTGCNLASVDDCLCFKGTSTRPTENVLVEDSKFYSNCNAIKMGTDSQGNFRNAVFRRLDIGGADDGKVEDLAESNTHKNVVGKRKSRTEQSSGGITWQAVDGMVIENIVVTDCVVSRARAPLFMRLGDRGRFITGDPRAPAGAKCKAKVHGGQLEPMGWHSPVGAIRNVAFINITGEHNGNFGCSALGIPGHRIENVLFKNIKLGVAGGGTQADAACLKPELPAVYPDPGVFMKQPAHGIYFRHVDGAVVENAEFKTKSPDARPVFAGSDALNIKVDGKLLFAADAVPPATGAGKQAAAKTTPLFNEGVWPDSQAPAGCPFPQSTEITGIVFTGRHAEYGNNGQRSADTWYPTWADDDRLYTPFADGKVCVTGSKKPVGSWSGGYMDTTGKKGTDTGYAVIEGADPLNLKITTIGLLKHKPFPYGGQYPCGSLAYNGVWYHGSYVLDTPQTSRTGWCTMGPFVGFDISKDGGKTWQTNIRTAKDPLFGESGKTGVPVKMWKLQKEYDASPFAKGTPGTKVKIGAPHVVDFGKNLQHSPDGKAYLVAQGDTRPIPQTAYAASDQAFLVRVKPSPETMNDPNAYEFFGGHDAKGTPIWTNDIKQLKPLFEWNDHMGCVTMTYNAPLKKYLVWVTDTRGPQNECSGAFDSYLLESSQITGPWKMVVYLRHFGDQAYFINSPSRFTSTDGQTMWICFSGQYEAKAKCNTAGSSYALCLREIRLATKPEK
jgi:hypothetical protein